MFVESPDRKRSSEEEILFPCEEGDKSRYELAQIHTFGQNDIVFMQLSDDPSKLCQPFRDERQSIFTVRNYSEIKVMPEYTPSQTISKKK